MNAKNIIQMELSKIIPYENNPRNNDEAVEKVANSIKEFGFTSPIIVDKDMVVICGHTRLKAAEQLNMKKAPVIVADWLDAQQVKALRLADNKVGELAGWDFNLLDAELDDIIDFDMGDFGFIDTDIEPTNDMFEDIDPSEKEPKMITCPHCGKQFEKV